MSTRRTTRRPRRLLEVAIALLALAAAACSGSSPGPGGAATTSGPTSAAASATPSEDSSGGVVLLVHGFATTAAGYSCAAYWGALEGAFRRWAPNLRTVTVGYESGDHDCDAMIGSDDPNTPIEDLGGQLASYVETTYSSKGEPVLMVGHSMGGLVIRAALARAGDRLLVPRAVTMSSPHAGTPDARVCPQILQCREQVPGSVFLSKLAPSPQGRGGTAWTVFGGAGDRLVPAASAVDMTGARRIVFERPAYDHVTILLDGSDAQNAVWQVHTGDGTVTRRDQPHSLRAVFLALTGS